MTRLEEFSSTSAARRIGLAIVAVGLVVGAVPASPACAETKASTGIERVAAAVAAPGSERFAFPKLHAEVAQRRRACTEVVGTFEAGARRISEINADASMSPTDRLAAMVGVAREARGAAAALRIQPDPWREGVDMPFDKALDSVARHLGGSIGEYVGNARSCVRESDRHLRSMNAPEGGTGSIGQAAAHRHVPSGRSLTDAVMTIRRVPFSHP